MINTASGTPDSYIHPDYANATYDHDKNQATPEVAWPDVYRRYATLCRRIDDGVGDIMQLLKDLKIDQNTLVVFTSDNGPSIESYLKEDYEPVFFNSFGPFDGIKRDVWEGGVRMPTLVQWPGTVPVQHRHYPAQCLLRLAGHLCRCGPDTRPRPHRRGIAASRRSPEKARTNRAWCTLNMRTMGPRLNLTSFRPITATESGIRCRKSGWEIM